MVELQQLIFKILPAWHDRQKPVALIKSVEFIIDAFSFHQTLSSVCTGLVYVKTDLVQPSWHI